MSDYVKTTNFTAKDALASGDPNKVAKGSDVDTEFDNIATAVATKTNKISSPVNNDFVKQTTTGDIQAAGFGMPNVNADITASDEELNYSVGVTSAIQTQIDAIQPASTQTLTNKTINADNNTISNIDNNEIKAGAGIDATKIGGGSVDNTEFSYLNGVTSSIQTQLDAATAFRGAMAYRSSNQTINPSTLTKVEWSGNIYDTDSIVDTTNNRLTVPSGVTRVRISYTLMITPGSGVIRGSLYKNGSISKPGCGTMITTANSGETSTLNYTSPVITVSGGDYYELQAYHTGGSSESILHSLAGNVTWFAMEIIE